MSVAELDTQPAAQGLDAPTAPATGLVLGGRYQLAGPRGRGGMGEVWEAVHLTLGHRVAVKTLREVHDGARVARFLQEAKVAAALRHPGIVRVSDFGNERDVLWFAMELVEGETLDTFLQREAPMEPARVLSLLAPLFEAVAWLHAQGVIHRDLKPANVILEALSGRDAPSPRLLDFGIARRVDLAGDLTATGDVLGTPRYMAPEQARGERDVGAAADQYALALIVYEAVTCASTHDEAGLALLHARSLRPPVSASSRRAGLPSPFVEALMRALSLQPGERYPSVDAFARALGEAVTAPSPRRPARRWLLALVLPFLVALTVAAWLNAAPRQDQGVIATRLRALTTRTTPRVAAPVATPTPAAPVVQAATPARATAPTLAPRRATRALPIDRVYRATPTTGARDE